MSRPNQGGGPRATPSLGGRCLALALEKALGLQQGQLPCSYSEWPLLPSWPAAPAQASSLPGTFWKRLAVGGGCHSLGSERLLFFLGLYKRPWSARAPGPGGKPGLASVWGNPSPAAVALIYHQGQGRPVWPEEASVCSFTSCPKQVTLEPFTPLGREGPTSKDKIGLKEINLDHVAGRRGGDSCRLGLSGWASARGGVGDGSWLLLWAPSLWGASQKTQTPDHRHLL